MEKDDDVLEFSVNALEFLFLYSVSQKKVAP